MFFLCVFLKFDIVLSLTVFIKNVCNIENNFLSQRVCKGLRDNVLTVGWMATIIVFKVTIDL